MNTYFKFSLLLTAGLLASVSSLAAGTGQVQAYPHLAVIADPVDSIKKFPIPDSSQTVDLSGVNMNETFAHAVEAGSMQRFTVQTGTSTEMDPCAPLPIHIRAAVTDLSLSDSKLDLTLGYSSGGIINPLPTAINANASVDFNFGQLKIDFFVCTSSGGVCTDALTSTEFDSKVSAVTGDVKLQWGNLGPDFSGIWATDFATLIEGAFEKGIAKFLTQPEVLDLPWQTHVSWVAGNQVGLNVGIGSGIALNQVFSVYQQLSAPLCATLPMGLIQINSVDTDSASAVILAVTQSRGIVQGDVIKVHALSQ